MQDPKNGVIASTASDAVIDISPEYKTFDDTFTPEFSLKSEIISGSGGLEFSFSQSVWQKISQGKYRYKIENSS